MSDLFQNRSDIFFATPNYYDFQRETFQTKSDTQKNRHAGHLPPGVPRTTNQSRYSSWGGFFIASRKPATCKCSRSRPLGGRFHFGTDSLVRLVNIASILLYQTFFMPILSSEMRLLQLPEMHCITATLIL